MNSAEFVTCVAKEKEALLATYLDAGSGAAVAKDIESLRLTTTQREAMKKILDGALTDAFYTLLLALDGAATLDGKQRRFELRDEDGVLLTGDLESPAWQAFHGKTSK